MWLNTKILAIKLAFHKLRPNKLITIEIKIFKYGLPSKLANFLANFKLLHRAHAPKLKLCIHFTKSPKFDNIFRLRLWMLEHNDLILMLCSQ